MAKTLLLWPLALSVKSPVNVHRHQGKLDGHSLGKCCSPTGKGTGRQAVANDLTGLGRLMAFFRGVAIVGIHECQGNAFQVQSCTHLLNFGQGKQNCLERASSNCR